jgi:hypothetical protein
MQRGKQQRQRIRGQIAWNLSWILLARIWQEAMRDLKFVGLSLYSISLLLIGTWCKSKLVFQKKSICNMAKRPGRRQGVKTTISSFGSTNNDDNDELDSDEAFKQLR